MSERKISSLKALVVDDDSIVQLIIKKRTRCDWHSIRSCCEWTRSAGGLKKNKG